jgi:hypothetical protein
MIPLASTEFINHWPPKTTRHPESRQAYMEVQDRHENIKKIERTLEELAQLFNDVGTLFLLPKIPG